MGLMKDDMIFEPYFGEHAVNDVIMNDITDIFDIMKKSRGEDMIYDIDSGYQCKMKVQTGIISVRYKGYGLFTNENKPYEVWYPEDNAPTGYQTADNIWNYIKKISN